ncbi:FHA domain-containing protein [Leptothermofonsia sp. ETS-13]|uniref:FHA domain-containing protein n=1 Tax=Leptothermofonsia sp. ETS-13 TaxID=3035696 RepID=UPI003BA19C57
MTDSQSLIEYPSHVVRVSGEEDLEQRLGLYRVFLKLYEHHRGLLDEILDLENSDEKWRSRAAMRYVQGVVQKQAHLMTNLVKGKTQVIYQPEGVWVIGRDRKAALPIQDKRLSRRHAAIQFVENEGFYLIDLNSTNGSFVNGEAVRQCAPLKDGDQIRLGSLAFTFFICEASRMVESLPADVLEQVNTLRKAIASANQDLADQESGYSSITSDWETPFLIGPEETAMFPVSSVPPKDLLPEAVTPELSTAQQAKILDRFLRR